MIGPEDGQLIEVRWTPALRERIAELIASDAQFPEVPIQAFASREQIAMHIAARTRIVRRAVSLLGSLLAGAGEAGVLDLDVQDACAGLLAAGCDHFQNQQTNTQ